MGVLIVRTRPQNFKIIAELESVDILVLECYCPVLPEGSENSSFRHSHSPCLSSRFIALNVTPPPSTHPTHSILRFRLILARHFIHPPNDNVKQSCTTSQGVLLYEHVLTLVSKICPVLLHVTLIQTLNDLLPDS